MNPNEIADLSHVSQQRTFLASMPQKPSPESPLYIERITERHADGSQSHTVIGMHVVLAKGHANGLWDTFHTDRAATKLNPLDPKRNVKLLRICCDTLDVRGELCVPEADVEIFARRVIWTGAEAAINTTPLDWSLQKAANASGGNAGTNGTDGRNAGAVTIYASVVEPVNDGRPRVIALGGRGQDPGAGIDGSRGKSMGSFTSIPYAVRDSGISTSRATVTFDPPAVFVSHQWLWGLVEVAKGQNGENALPENGTDAVAPGVPGNAGDGGLLTTNVAALVGALRNTAGSAGRQERNYSGGAAGTPIRSGRYHVKLWHNVFGTDNASFERNLRDERTTARGADRNSSPAAKLTGTAPQPVVVAASNAWLHPLSLQRCLEYARAAFLAGARDEVELLMAAYADALAAEMPKNGAWDDGNATVWAAAHAEAATMLQRLRAQLDYFGNGAGYTPLFSLRGSTQLYEQETGRALQTLLLTRWIVSRERDAKEAQAALGEAIVSLNADSQQAAAQVVSAEAKITSAAARIESLEQELSDMSNQLEMLRSQLLSKVQNDLLQQAQIKFMIRMAAAMCQVIPVGQPALGSIGSLAGAASEFIGGDDTKAPDTVSRMGDVLKKAAAASKKASDARKKAEKEKGKSPDKDAESAKKSGADWSQVGKGLAPAMAQVSAGMKALQVPESEVEAQLQKMEAESPEWKAMTEKMRVLNKRKVALFEELASGFESLGDGYARLTSNAAATYTMQQQREQQLGRLNPAATGFVREMEQRSRNTLIRYLYLMVRSYETTVFRTINVDWNLTDVMERLLTLVEPNAGFNAASIAQNAKALAPVFNDNINRVRTQLLRDFDFGEQSMTLQLGLSATQTPALIDAVNSGGAVRIDPLRFGLLLPDRQLARLNTVTLASLELDPKGPQLPETHNLVVTLQPARTGTMRRDEQIYGVYSDQPRQWNWTRLASGEVRASVPSNVAEDMLNLILGAGAERIKQKVALPPMWSDLSISVRFSPALPEAQRPRITRLYFQFLCDGSPAPEHQCVLTVQPSGTPGGAVIDCPADLAHRGPGFDSMVRIFSRGAQVRVSAPPTPSAAVFDSWDLLGRDVSRIGETAPAVTLTMSDHVLARCTWERGHRAAEPVVATMDVNAVAEVMREQPEAMAARRKVLADAPPMAAGPMAAGPESAAPVPVDLPMRVAADESATILGLARSLADVDVVEEGADGWVRVNYRGVVGWIRTLVAVSSERPDASSHDGGSAEVIPQ